MAVSATFTEAYAMVTSLRPHLREIVRKRNVDELRDALLPGMNAAQWLARQKSCAFLDDTNGSCMAYERRPLACRRFMSFDANACGVVGGEVSSPATPKHMVASMHQQMLGNQRRAGLPWGLAPLPVQAHLAFTEMSQGRRALAVEAGRLQADTMDGAISRWIDLA